MTLFGVAVTFTFKKNVKKEKNYYFSIDKFSSICYIIKCQRKVGRLAQLVRAPALQAGGHRFESCIAHHYLCRNSSIGRATDL